ncbi:hypothetical protein DL769_002250 [Monosporascus sp. CRB-8-3]|nr:hypothetical protein DL769_002250 [Monosporascus sp. CRB-8-3]
MDEGSSPDGVTALSKSALIAAFLLKDFVFSEPSLHPFGTGAPWSESGRRPVLSPVPDPLSRYPGVKTLPTESAHSDESNAMAWVSGFRPKWVVTVDFGATKAVGEATSSAASGMSPAVAVTYVAVGAEAKVYSDAEPAALGESISSPCQTTSFGLNSQFPYLQMNISMQYQPTGNASSPEMFLESHRTHYLPGRANDKCVNMSSAPETGKGPIEVKMEEDAAISRPNIGENATAQVERPVAGPEAASPAPSNASSTSRPPYIPQFSAATQMILQRINGKSGSLSSALSSASAVAKTIEQSTFEDAKRRLVMNMNTSLTMPLPTPPPAPKPRPSTSLPVNDAFQLRTPTVARPTTSTSKGATKVPAKRGRPPKGTKRKRAKDDQDDSSSLSDLPNSGGEDAPKDQATPTMTKSGRQVQRPSQYNPSSTAGSQKRKHYGKRTSEQALCRKRAHLSTVPHGQLVNILMYSLELHPDLPIFPTHETGPAAKRSSHGLPAGPIDDNPFPPADACLSGPIHYASQASAPDTSSVNSQQPGSKTRSGAKRSAESQERAMRETSIDSIPASWPRVGQGCLAGLDIKEDDLQDKDDFEAFSVATYDSQGRKVMENGMPVKAN